MVGIDKKEFLINLTERNNRTLNDALSGKTIGIAGCGGLGSNVAQMLVRIGIENLVIADFDTVAVSNLNRQFYFYEDVGLAKVDALETRLKMINPFITIQKHNIKITQENLFRVYKNSDVIVEAFDQASEKTMLIDSFLQHNTNKYLVSASGMGGLESSNLMKTVKFGKNVYVCGDFSNDFNLGVMAPRVTLAAAHEANMVIRIITGLYEP